MGVFKLILAVVILVGFGVMIWKERKSLDWFEKLAILVVYCAGVIFIVMQILAKI